MGLMRTAMKAGIAKKVWNEVRKPQNRAKAKELFSKIRGKSGDRSGSHGAPGA
ncbi:MAG TPA: hypothetical protein VGV93_04500 [Acidimicrobiales bacterium]|nr:hypothetical protein [Acidimicrobiales bacterium]